MTWLQKLYATYDACAGNPDFTDPPQADDEKEKPALMPVAHTSQQAQICITLDGDGNFLHVQPLTYKKQYILPATENSASRTSDDTPHPLADKIHHCAKDYQGGKKNLYTEYEALLKAWCESPHSHPKAQAVLAYVTRGTMIKDLLREGILHADANGALLTQAPPGLKNSLFNLLTPKKIDGVSVRDQGEAFVIWEVNIPGDLEPRTWKDKSLQEAWIAYDASQQQKNMLCMVSGRMMPATAKHPRNIRRPGDGAKLISSNDQQGFTYRGRFITAEEACTVGYETSHKAHNALRWLLARQGYRNGDQAVLAWTPSGAGVPNPCEPYLPPDHADFCVDEEAPLPDYLQEATEGPQVHMDVGEAFSLRLAKARRGYKAELKDAESIAVLSLDSASPGRLAVTFYREQVPSDYLGRLEDWQNDMAWLFPLTKAEAGARGSAHSFYTLRAPVPKEIASAAYGRRIDDKLLKATMERLLPCIVDKALLPRDLVDCCVRRACNRAGQDQWEWMTTLSVACGMYRGFYSRLPDSQKKEYSMSLDEKCDSRDYLYGRLLAVAEWAERRVLERADEKRPTNAERLMSRFADHPYSTWLLLEKQLSPYLQRLQNSDDHLSRWVYSRTRELFTDICEKFDRENFISSQKLKGEFLLAYHCQWADLFKKQKNKIKHCDEKGEEA